MGQDIPILTARREVKFRAILDKLLVEEIPVQKSTLVVGGVIARDDSHSRMTQKPMTGRVIAVGDGVPMGGVLMPMPYKVGQVVRCSEYGREYIFVRPEDEFDKTAPRHFLIRAADTHGEML